MKKILLMHVTSSSGHHRASLAIQNCLREVFPSIKTLNIDSLNYINPILEKIIYKTYLSMVRNKPEVWGYLYDNPKVVKNTQKLKDFIHKCNSGKLKSLLESFKPNVIVCTQAFPCGMVADYKLTYNINTPLIAVLTDYFPHSYWLYKNVDIYVVASEDAIRRLVNEGIPKEKIKYIGIPVDSHFTKEIDEMAIFNKLNLSPNKPTILIMGGGQGIGPMKDIVDSLDGLDYDLQILVVCGLNNSLFRYLDKRKKIYKKKLVLFGYINNVYELMHISKLIITKPGGLTTAEALSKKLPMIIVNPIPGQEENNSRFLLNKSVALKAKDAQEVYILIKELLDNPNKLNRMRQEAEKTAKSNSAIDIANLIMEYVDKPQIGRE